MRTLWASAFAVALLGAATLVSSVHAPKLPHARAAPPARHSARALPDVAAPPAEDARVVLGRKLFFDSSLSEPAGTSCAACHAPEHGYSSLNGGVTGVPRGSRPGHLARRTAPSLMYLRFVPRFHIEWDDEAELPEARGGFFWDGRVSSIHDLVRQPLLNPDEMANPTPETVAKKVGRAVYAQELSANFDSAFASTEATIEAIGLCLEAFLTRRELAPFSSRYDDFVRGKAQLSEQEQRGLALFKDLDKGACASCHRLNADEPELSLFTDFGYDSVAAPRNAKLALAAGHFDLGLCERHDPLRHTEDPWFCGAFRTPSLRNVALRQSYFHNGAFTRLRDVVRYYATRSTSPEAWYAHGSFDDLPEKYWQYVNSNSPPYNRRKGDAPALDDGEIDAVVAFLGTLSDRELAR